MSQENLDTKAIRFECKCGLKVEKPLRELASALGSPFLEFPSYLCPNCLHSVHGDIVDMKQSNLEKTKTGD